ncbi:MAG TPA: branched-chain amino acid ABC transporter ATP-binding protein/permease [Solirubrobacteraceae bacterium]|nr:branched-chain amino acid ABC transporter ATP-binding protein/permease [Solirubrobacteraceae bacterium]
MIYYITNLLVYAGVDAIACLGLSQQFGVGGVTNFGFIIFQAAGAYTAGVLSLPSSSANGGFQHYVLGWNLPFPLPWIGAAIVGGLLAIPFAAIVGRRLRGDFAAVGLLVTAVMFNLLVNNYVPLFNGAAGLSLVPSPLQSHFNPQSGSYQWGYGIAALLLALGTYWFVQRLTQSPFGRTLRAMRDNDLVADSLGKNLRSLRTSSLVIGGAIAGLSGGVLVGFINLWDPQAWGYAETVVLFAAVIIGGLGNHRGAILGAILVPVAFEEATRYIPPVAGNPNLIPALQWVVIGCLILLFLWFRPQGILPERRRKLSTRPLPAETTLGAADGDGLPGGPAASDGRGPDPSATPATTAVGSGNGAGGHDVILECRDLTRTFGGVPAVDGVSMAFERGRLTGIIGPNGAGKSTVLAMLAGTLPVTSGHVLLRGEDVTGLPAYRRARKGLVRTFQLASEFKRLTVLENLVAAIPNQRGETFRGAMLGRRFWGGQERASIERAEAMLERFGLLALADRYAGDLSGGQRRLVEIMRALMAEPEVLLLDEPMAGVHPRLAHQIGMQLVRLCEEGTTVIMVEHELSIMDEFCDPVFVLADGKVLAEGTMAALRAKEEVVEAYLVG